MLMIMARWMRALGRMGVGAVVGGVAGAVVAASVACADRKPQSARRITQERPIDSFENIMGWKF
jgi:hypothetical protein